MENNDKGSKFLTGFIWGAIIGAGTVFLFGTKKGKKLLKTLSEEGMSKVSDLLEAEDAEYDVSDDNLDEKEENAKSGNGAREENKKPVVRRFFRRSPK